MTEPAAAEQPDQPTPTPKAKGKGVVIQHPEQDWAEPKRSETGHQLADDGFPLTGVARAMALAEAGKTTDPLELVSDDAIAAHDPKAAAADRDAVDRYHAEQAAAAQQEGN